MFRKFQAAQIRNGEGGFGQVIWSRPTEQNAPAAFLLARDRSVSENFPMISVAAALGPEIVSCSVVLVKTTREYEVVGE